MRAFALGSPPLHAPRADPSPSRSWIPLAVAVAVIARVAWLSTKPFWRDEAWVARLAGQPLERLLQDPYPVPLGFLAAVKLTGAIPGLPPEVSLRLLPLGAGLAVLPVLAMLARRLGASAWTVAAAVWAAAGLPALVYYSRELKPYSLDLLLGMLVPWLALEAEDDAPPRRRRAVAAGLLACAVATPWISFGANFVVGPTLAWLLWRRGRHSALPWVAAAAFALSFAGAYETLLAVQSEVPRLRATWREELDVEIPGPTPLRAAAAVGRYFTVSVPYLFPGVWPVAALLAIVGLWTWPRPHRGLLAGLCLAPALATTAAVLLGRYVMGHGRLLLFAAGPLVLLSAAGLVHLAGAGARLVGRSGGERAATAIAAVAALVWSTKTVAHRVAPYENDVSRYFLYDVLHDVEPIIAEAERRVPPGGALMVSRYAGEAFLFYGQGRLPGAVVCTRRTCPDDGPVLQGWLRSITDRGFMIVLEEELRSGRRNTARLEGFAVRTVARARGVRLWEVTRVQP